jgi:hypothetical protein
MYVLPRQNLSGTRNIHAMESLLAPYCGGCLEIAGMRAAFTHGAIPEARSLANAEDRASLLNLIGLLHIRNPRFREINRAVREGAAKLMVDLALSNRVMWDKVQTAGVVPMGADTDYEKSKQSYKPEDYKLTVTNEAQIATEMQTFDHALPSLFERKWVLVKAPEGSPGFVTGDHPVSLTWSEPPSGPRPLGLRTPGTRIFFPITPKLAVVGTFEGEDGRSQFTDNEVAAANGVTALNAQRQVYAERGDFRYRIDSTQPPRAASELLNDERFLRPAKPTLVT